MARVEVEKALLSKYSDKELIHYLREELSRALDAKISVETTTEAALVMRLTKIGSLMPLLKAVDDHMNGVDKAPHVVI